MNDVFISYSDDSKKYAARLSQALKAKGLSTWESHKDLGPGDLVRENIQNFLKNSKIAVFLITDKSSQSSWQQMEFMAALDSSWSDPSKVMVSIVIGQAVAPPFLRDWNIFKIKNQKRDLPRAADLVARILSQKMPQKVNRSVEKEQKRRLNALEQDVIVLRNIEGKDLVREATEYLRRSQPAANRSAVELLDRHLKSGFEGQRSGARRGASRGSKTNLSK